MDEQIEQMMRTLKLGGLAKEWRSVEHKSNEQYVSDLLMVEMGHGICHRADISVWSSKGIFLCTAPPGARSFSMLIISKKRKKDKKH